jgi:hypothetical protein
MHSEPQTFLHEIAPPFRSSWGGKIHLSCTAQFIRFAATDKTAIHYGIQRAK